MINAREALEMAKLLRAYGNYLMAQAGAVVGEDEKTTQIRWHLRQERDQSVALACLLERRAHNDDRIAPAPQLLQAAKWALQFLETAKPTSYTVMEALNQAITQAEGPDVP